jgi:hypothetical protein
MELGEIIIQYFESTYPDAYGVEGNSISQEVTDGLVNATIAWSQDEPVSAACRFLLRCCQTRWSWLTC